MALMSASPSRPASRVYGWKNAGRRRQQFHQPKAHHWDAQSRIRARRVLQREARLQFAGQLLIKTLLIALVSIGFLYCASAILATTTSILFKSAALGMWACGFVPVSYYLWNS